MWSITVVLHIPWKQNYHLVFAIIIDLYGPFCEWPNSWKRVHSSLFLVFLKKLFKYCPNIYNLFTVPFFFFFWFGVVLVRYIARWIDRQTHRELTAFSLPHFPWKIFLVSVFHQYVLLLHGYLMPRLCLNLVLSPTKCGLCTKL